jgi:hypothetical protein
LGSWWVLFLDHLIIVLFDIFSFLFIDGTVSTAVSSREMGKLEKKKRELEEDNNLLRTKLDILLEMLAEVTAEHELRRVG